MKQSLNIFRTDVATHCMNLRRAALIVMFALCATRAMAQDASPGGGIGVRLGFPVTGLTFVQHPSDLLGVRATAGWGMLIARDDRVALGPGAMISLAVAGYSGPHGGGEITFGPTCAYVRDQSFHESPPLPPGALPDPNDNIRNVFAAGLSFGFGSISASRRREFLFTITPMYDLTRRHSFALGIDMAYIWY